MRLWLSVMGCCVFAYLLWASVGLDTSGKLASWMGCCELATFFLFGGALNVSLPSVCANDDGEAVDGFWSVELSGMCREQSIAELTVECRLVHPKAQLSPSFSIFLFVSAPCGIQILSQGMKRFTRATAVPPSARWQTLPSHAGTFFHPIVCLSRFFGSWDIILPVLFHPRRGEAWCDAEQRLVISLRCQEFQTCHLVVWAWSTQNKGNPPKNPPSSKCSLFLKCSCVWGRKWVFVAPAALLGFLSVGELSCSRISLSEEGAGSFLVCYLKHMLRDLYLHTKKTQFMLLPIGGAESTLQTKQILN